MSVDSITLSFEGRTNAIVSTQDWTTDPDRIEVVVTRDFLKEARRAVDFLKEVDMDYAVKCHAFDYNIFQGHGDGEEDYDGELEYDGANVRIRQNGMLRAEFPAMYSNDSMHVELGSIAELESKMDAEQDDNQSPAM